MNKIDLIKALFKDPTIKALYESGHFNASDINRAILMEAADMEEALVRGTPEFNVRQRISTDYKQGENSRDFTKFLNKYLENHKNGVIQHARFEELNDDLKKFLLEYLGKKIKLAQDQMKIIKAAETAQQTNSDADKKQVKGAKQKTDQKNAELEKKVDQALDAAHEGGEGAASSEQIRDVIIKSIEKFYADGNNDKQLIQRAEQGNIESIIQPFYFGELSIKPQEGRPSSELQNQIRGSLTDEHKSQILEKIKELSNSQGKENTADSIKTSGEDTSGNEDNTGTTPFDQWLEKKPEPIKQFVNSNELFKTNLAKAYGEAVTAKPEGEDETQQTTADSSAEPAGEPSNVPSNEPETEADVQADIDAGAERVLGDDRFQESLLEGIYLVNEQEGEEQEGEGTDQQGAPVEVDDVREMLKQLEELFKNDGISINVEEIWTASQEKDGEQDGASEDDDEDVSPPELAEFQEAWTENLQTFFGKNPNKSSFMRRLLLKDQAQMLYETISVLEQIESGEQKGKEGQAASLTDMNKADGKKKEDPKPANTETSTDQGGKNQGQGGDGNTNVNPQQNNENIQRLDEEPTVDASDTQKMQTAQRASMKKVAQDQSSTQPQQSEKVQLPPKKKRIIKQDLQAMVDLLRDVKKAISNYRDYSTRNSVDPRFDGSKLKAKLDNLLAQVQEDIFDLDSNLELPTQQTSDEEGSIEEALNGIFLEKADPQRKEKIALVKDVYMEAKRLYVKSLAVSIEELNWEKSKEEAGNILEILKREDFIALFPTGMSTASGKIMTVTDAYDVMKDLIQKFIEIVRDIVLIAKTDYVSPTNIRRSKMQLKDISRQIAELFKIPSKFSPEELRQAKQEEAEDENNKSLTPIAVEKLDKQDNDNGANVTQDGPTIEPGGQDPSEFMKQEIDNAPNVDDKEKEDLKQSVEDSKEWFSNLGDKSKKAIGEFVEQMVSRGAQRLEEQEVTPYKNEITPDMKSVIEKFTKKTRDLHKGFGKLIPLAIQDMDEDFLEDTISLMQNDSENFAKHLKTIFKLKEKISVDTVMKFASDLAGRVAGVASDLAGKAGDAAKAAMKPIKELYDQIKPEIQTRLQSFARELTAIKGATKYLTEVTMKHFLEMLTTFFKKNLKVIKSKGESLFKKKLEEAANSDELTDDQKQSLEKNKGKLIDSYDKVSFPAKKFMDSLPGLLGSSFALFAIELIEFIEKVVKFIKTTYRDVKKVNLQIVALAMFLKFSNGDKFENFDEQSMDDLNIKSSELIAVAPTTNNSPNSTPGSETRKESLEKALKPIIEAMLKEQYSY